MPPESAMSVHALRPEFEPDRSLLTRAFEKQRAAARLHPYPTAREREAHLRALLKLLRGKRAEFAKAIHDDFGSRAPQETDLEVMATVQGINYALRHLSSWMRPERRRVHPAFWLAQARVEYQPLGVVGVISPWNYPINLALSPLTCALAAGNRVLIKPSELAPRMAEELAKAIEESFAPEVVSVITGGVEVAEAFSSLPFDHILFTGSTRVGKMVMRAAAENLTPVTLELGGKSPVIIDEGFAVERAVESILSGKLLNSGQTCIASDYILVPEGQRDALVAALKATTARMYPTIASNNDYSSIVNDRQYARLQEWLADAKSKGATLVPINPSNDDAASLRRKLPLTLVLDPTDDMIVMQEELFGTVLPIKTYRRFDEAVEYVNDHPRPLALYLFSDRRDNVQRVLHHTHSGGLDINTTFVHVGVDDLPFGGVGPSGMGSYHGREGFLRFSHGKSVYQQFRPNGMSLLYPPYGGTFKAVIDRLIG